MATAAKRASRAKKVEPQAPVSKLSPAVTQAISLAEIERQGEIERLKQDHAYQMSMAQSQINSLGAQYQAARAREVALEQAASQPITGTLETLEFTHGFAPSAGRWRMSEFGVIGAILFAIVIWLAPQKLGNMTYITAKIALFSYLAYWIGRRGLHLRISQITDPILRSQGQIAFALLFAAAIFVAGNSP